MSKRKHKKYEAQGTGWDSERSGYRGQRHGFAKGRVRRIRRENDKDEIELSIVEDIPPTEDL